jgi:hypothetical protein
MDAIGRRYVLGLLGAGAAAPFLPASAAAAPGYVMWRDPGCGCCLEWARRIEAAFGKKLPVVETGNMAAVKRAQGVPADLQSCHTALIEGLVVEGHVPPADIKRLLAARKASVRGLAVPGMPAGAPGMDVGHDHRQRYQVFAFAADGRRAVFAVHG